MFSPYCGIDFGTSNSTIGSVHQNGPSLIPLEGTKQTLPSAIFFNFDADTTTYGREAIDDYVEGEFGRLLRSLKSVLGSPLMDEKTRIKARQVSYIDIISQFISELKQRGEAATHTPFTHVVMGRPVQFVDNDPVADRSAQAALEDAARRAGFKHIEFQYEPIAAAINYEQSVQHEELALIVDLGGGTSDFTVVRIRPRASINDRRDDILATHGIHVGGTDFDKSLSLATIMPLLGYKSKLRQEGEKQLLVPASYYFDLATWHKIHALYDAKIITELKQLVKRSAEPNKISRLQRAVAEREGHRLAIAAEESKIALSALDDHLCQLNYLEAGLQTVITLPQLEQSLDDQVERISKAAEETVSRAGISADKITKLFMTGGSTAIPCVRHRITTLFSNADIVDGDRFGSVGLGLATDAQSRFA